MVETIIDGCWPRTVGLTNCRSDLVHCRCAAPPNLARNAAAAPWVWRGAWRHVCCSRASRQPWRGRVAWGKPVSVRIVTGPFAAETGRLGARRSAAGRYRASRRVWCPWPPPGERWSDPAIQSRVSLGGVTGVEGRGAVHGQVWCQPVRSARKLVIVVTAHQALGCWCDRNRNRNFDILASTGRSLLI